VPENWLRRESGEQRGTATFSSPFAEMYITDAARRGFRSKVSTNPALRLATPKGGAVPHCIYSLFKKSVISGSVQSTAPMNLRRITPFRSMMKVSGQP